MRLRLAFLCFRLLRLDYYTWSLVAQRSDIREIGSLYGGWAVPTDLIEENSVCYCVGCGEDISFDMALIEDFECLVYGFDPTPKSIDYVTQLPLSSGKYQFRPYGIYSSSELIDFYLPRNREHVSLSIPNIQKSEDKIRLEVRRLSDVMSVEAHSTLDLLKLDIEGAEYEVIDSMLEDNILPRVLCVEFDEVHTPIDRHFKKRIRRAIASLKKIGYQIVYIQRSGNYTFVRDMGA
jgi:FkbM family methyltransferase